MTTKEYDTDPSTPSARRPIKGRASGSPPAAVDTDPGLAPPPERSAPPAAPLGIRVPAPSVRPPPAPPPPVEAEASDALRSTKKDSVELLLEGMAEQSLDRSRTTPQTDGQASASYHAEHTVRAAERPVLADEPSVLFERPATPVTVRLARPAAPASRDGEADPTVLTPTYTFRRVLLALCAGAVVVGAIFVMLQMTERRGTTDSSGAAPVVVAVTPSPPAPAVPVTATPAPIAPSAAVESAVAAVPPPSAIPSTPASVAAVPSASAAPEMRPAPSIPQTPRRRSKLGGSGPASDLGEFKTTY